MAGLGQSVSKQVPAVGGGTGDADARAPRLSVIVPVYKEEGNILPFLSRMRPVLESQGDYEILFCLDPSPDRTEEVIAAQAAADPRIRLLVFSRRFGQPAATMAGLLNCRGDACVVIDVDLQDPPELIPQMMARLSEGYEVVYAKRSSRRGETLVKKAITEVGYAVINRITDVSIPRNVGDFRVISRRVIEEIRQLSETHGFLRGLVALVGFRQTFVEYERDARFTGQGNYNRYLGSLKIAFNGIFGFSTYPLSFLLWGGFFMACLSMLMVAYILVTKLIIGQDYPLGVPTLTVLVVFLGGIQMMAIGILGEYIGRIYDEVRRRPQYIIDRAINCLPLAPYGPGRRPTDAGGACGIAGAGFPVGPNGGPARSKPS